MAIGVLNPNDNAHSTPTRPTPVLGGAAQRRWFSDGLNTEIRDHDFNAILGQIRHVIDHFAIPDVEGDDTLLRQAIQAGAAALTGNIAAFQSLAPGVDKVPFWTSTAAASLTTFVATAYSRGLMANSTLAAWQTALGITAAGKPNVIAFGNLVVAADQIAYFTSNAGAMAVTNLSPLARTLIDDTTTAAMRATLGLTGAYSDFSSLTLTAVVPLVLNGGTITTGASPATINILSKSSADGSVGMSACAGYDVAQGAYLLVYGNNFASPSYAGDVRLQAGAGGNITFNGTPMGYFATGTDAANLTGVAPASAIPGASITAINASNITSGTLAAARMAPVQTEINTIQQNTGVGVDNAYTSYAGGGTASATRGAYLNVFGNQHPASPGRVALISGSTGYVLVQSAGVNIIVDNVFTGIGTALTALNASNIASGTLNALRMAAVQTEINTIQQNTGVGVDNAFTQYAGGGSPSVTRGAFLTVYGNQHAQAGSWMIQAGQSGVVSACLLAGGNTTPTLSIRNGTAPGTDNGVVTIAGGGSASTNTRGAFVNTYGNDHASNPGQLRLSSGNTGNVLIVSSTVTDLQATAAAAAVTWNFTNIATAAAGVEVRLDLASGNGLAGVRSSYIANINEGSNVVRLAFGSTGASGGTPVERAYIKAGLVVGAPTGADKGAGSINTVTLFVANTPITCVPLQQEFLAHGTVDLDKWDRYAVTGKHEAAHHFAKLLRDGVDPRDPLQFIVKMKEMQALPGMPTLDGWEPNSMSMGEMFSRLWLAVEMLAVAWMSRVEQDDERRTVH